jgi:hypothetical protein
MEVEKHAILARAHVHLNPLGAIGQCGISRGNRIFGCQGIGPAMHHDFLGIHMGNHQKQQECKAKVFHCSSMF